MLVTKPLSALRIVVKFPKSILFHPVVLLLYKGGFGADKYDGQLFMPGFSICTNKEFGL